MKQWLKNNKKAVSIALGVTLAPCFMALLLFFALNPQYILAIFFGGMVLGILGAIGFAIYTETEKFIDTL